MIERIRPGKKTTPPKKAVNWSNALLTSAAVRRRMPNTEPFTVRPDLHPPNARPNGHMAMDTAPTTVVSTAWANAVISTSFSEGLQFLGYPFLAELAQRPEYRVISQTIAEEMTRKWGKFEAKGEAERQKETHLTPEAEQAQHPEDPEAAVEAEQEEREEEEASAVSEEKQDRIDELEEMFKELHIRECCKDLVEQDGYFGRAHLYLDTGDTDNRDELRQSIGSGKDSLSKVKVSPQKPLQRVKTVEAVWCYPTTYESVDPLKSDWYAPTQWYVMGKEIHASRLLKIVGNPVPDLLKPAYSFGGLSMSQMAQPYVDNWLRTRQSVNDLIQAFVVWGLKTNLQETLSLQGDQLFARLELFNRLRNNRGVMAIDKDAEEFFNVTAPLSGLESLQAQSQEHMAAVSRIPLVKLLGIQPTGLNASSEGEIRVFYDTIRGRQEWILTPIVTRLMHFCMLSKWGEIDPDIQFNWEPLWALDEKQQAEVDEVNARTAQIRIDTGVIDKMEERRRVANDHQTPYPGIDPDYEPELAAEEEEGLIPKGAGAGLRAIMGTGGGAAAPGLQEPDNPTPSEGSGEPGEDAVEASLADLPPMPADTGGRKVFVAARRR